MSADQSSERPFDAILECRGRPIGFRRTKWGGEIRAIERGYFPCSSTGYRSMGCYGEGENASAPTAEALEELAVNQERENASLLKRCHKALRHPGRPNGVGDFITATGAADMALGNGFYATPAMRAELWRFAYRIYSAIIDTPQAHPGHESQLLNRGAWTPEHCDTAFQRVVEARDWLRNLLDGNFTEQPHKSRVHYSGAFSYFELPAVAPEARVGAPALDMSLGLELTSADAGEPELEDEDADDELEALDEDDDSEESDSSDESPVKVTVTSRLVEVITSDAQMSLF